MSVHWTEHKAVDPSLGVIKWLLSFAIAYQAAVMTWAIIDSPKLVLPEASKGQSAATNTGGQSYDMASWHLFGEANEVVPDVQEEINAPKTRLRLVLLGVFVATDKTQSSAIISEQGRDGEFFKVGDRVQGRTRLSQVYEDKVILDNSGKLETLTFEDGNKLGAGITQTANPKKTTNKAKPKKPTSKSSRDFKRAIRKIKTPDEFVDFAKDQLQDPQQAMKNMGLKSAGNGYVLTNSATMLMSIGMKPGDKIISVNGHSLGDPEQDKTLIDEVRASGNASIVIERGSRRMTINHSF